MLKRAQEALAELAGPKRARKDETLALQPRPPPVLPPVLPQFGIELRAPAEHTHAAHSAPEGELVARALFRLVASDWLPRTAREPESECDAFEAAGLLIGPVSEPKAMPCPLSFQATGQVLAGLMAEQGMRGPRMRFWLRVYPWDVLLPCAGERDAPFDALHCMISYLARPLGAAFGADPRLRWGPLGEPAGAMSLRRGVVAPEEPLGSLGPPAPAGLRAALERCEAEPLAQQRAQAEPAQDSPAESPARAE